MVEAEILAACQDYLLLQGHFVARVNVGLIKNTYRSCNINGWPDLSGITKDGKGLGVECKSPKGKQSREQKMVQKNFLDRGAIYVVARSIEDLQGAGL